MLLQTASRFCFARQALQRAAKRNIGLSAVALQKAATVSDPIQQLFLDKVREYKAKSVGGKLVDATPQVEAAYKDEIDKLDRLFNAKGKDMTQFPTFNFTDTKLEHVGIGEIKETEVAAVDEVAEEEEEDNKPYFHLP